MLVFSDFPLFLAWENWCKAVVVCLKGPQARKAGNHCSVPLGMLYAVQCEVKLHLEKWANFYRWRHSFFYTTVWSPESRFNLK